jgi:hypothetical protein
LLDGIVEIDDGASSYSRGDGIQLLQELKPRKVTTALEEPDKDLVLASDDQPFNGNTCRLKILVPGEIGQQGARLIAGGYGFTDKYGWGDRVSNAQLVDCDYVYAGVLYPSEPAPGVTWAEAQPDGVELGSFVDTDLAEEFRGWRLWADDGGQGGVDIDPLGGFGKLLAKCYLVVTITKKDGSLAGNAALNVWWGRPNQ